MNIRGFLHSKWVRFGFWSVLYVLWVVWLGNYWWLFGLPVVFELCVSQKLKALLTSKVDVAKRRHNPVLSWIDAIIFAVVVVTFINIFFIQSFKIPSSSMESSLMTGDYLFVSKVTYGPRLPQTPLSVPFIHNVLPVSHKESYSKAVQWPYRRLKGFGNVERDDYVVFSFPHGDTVLTRVPGDDYYTHVRMTSREYAVKTYGPVVSRPVDKKDHYVKRCVAVAGDTLSIVDGWVYVNGKPQEHFAGIQNHYCAVTSGSPVNSKILRNMGLNPGDVWYSAQLPGYPALPLTEESLEKVRSLANVVQVTQNIDVYPPDYPDSEMMLFPFVETGWTKDNYGPLWIPRKGEEIKLSADNIPLYRRIIEVYEDNDFEMTGDGRFFINGVETDTYTFKMDYYFMMGDNRHDSLDSRYWGFVPEDHIVGKPSFLWFSVDSNYSFPKSIRWRRLFKFV